MATKSYPKYKDSGIEWIGKIPEHWSLRKMARSFNIIGSGTTPKADNLEYYNDGEIPWVMTGDLNDGNINKTARKVTEKAIEDYSTLKKYPINSLVIAMYGATIGKVGVLKIEACTNQACCVITGSDYYEHRYTFYWLLANRRHIINLSYGGGQPNISQEIIKTQKLTYPTLPEQKTIATYLDNKTKEIDDTIAKKQRLIELLEEERKATINEAVTKGLNPNVKMKDSGIEWIGEIPEHWEIKKIKHTSYVKGRIGWKGLRSDEFLDEGYAFLVTGTDFNNGKIFWESCYHIDKERYEEDPYIQLKEGDVLITKDGTIGKTAIVKELNKKACLNSGIFIVRPLDDEYLPDYIYYVLNSNIFDQYIDYTSRGSTIKHLYQNIFVEFRYPLPYIKEQKEIVNYLDEELFQNTQAIQKIQNQIELLKEYRQSLIFEGVTGKIDVREEY